MSNFSTATRKLLRSWATIAILVILFDALIAALYFFVSSREATPLQLLLTIALAIISFALFFIIQAIDVGYVEGALGDASSKPVPLLRRAVANSGVMLVATLPIILVAGLAAYLCWKIDASIAPSEPANFPWKTFALTVCEYLIFAVALPLAAIHLWIAVMSEGLKGAFKRIGRVLAAAFSPQALVIYTLGAIAFGVVPYFLFFTRTPIKQPWVEIILLGIRMVLGFVFVLFGWTLTLGALSVRWNERRTATVNDQTPVAPPLPSVESLQ